MSDVNTWNVAAASNNSAAPNGFPEGMPPSGVNDAAREVMAAVARYRSDTDGVNTSSGTNTITLAASRTMTAYAQGDLYTFKAGGTNSGATTLNVDSLGAKDVQFNGNACTGGEIVSGLMYTVVYDGTQFQLMNAASYPTIDITTLEVTNIKAKDGTASATIANSTGVMTLSSPVLTTPNIGIPSAGTLTNCNGLPISSGVSGLGANVAAFLATPSSANLAAAVTGETGSGALVFATSPSLVTPFLGTPTSGSLINCTGLPISTGVSGLGTGVDTFLATPSSANLASAVTDETGTGALVFANTPTLVTPTLGAASATSVANGLGAEATPSYAFTGDLDTGMWSPTADTVAVSTNAAERMRISSSGNISIGSNSVTAPSTGSTSRFQVIGTDTPKSSVVQATFSNVAGGPGKYFLKSRGTQASPIIVNDGDDLGAIAFEGHDGTQFRRAALIQAEVDGTPGASDMPGRLVFKTTADGAATATEHMRITSAGNVGIGTSSPATRFHVDGTIRYTNRPAAGTITAIGFDANGDLKASSSSQRYKYDIFGYDKGINEVMQLRPVSFKYNGETRQNIGFIAEEIDAAGLSEVMLYDEQNQPEGVLYANMVALLTKAIQEQQTTIAALEERLAAVEAQ